MPEMTDNELQNNRIEQARMNLNMAEKKVDELENYPDSYGYFLAMCEAIVAEQVYDQIVHYYQVKVVITREAAKIEFDRRMRKKYFQIFLVRKEIKLLEEKASFYSGSDKLRTVKILREILSLTIALGEMTRQANAFEFRTLESINKIK